MKPMEINAIFENQSTFWGKHSVFCSSTHSDSSPNKNPKIGNSDPPLSTKLLIKVLNGAHFLKKCIFLFELKSRCLRETYCRSPQVQGRVCLSLAPEQGCLRGQLVSALRFWRILASGLWETHQNYQ